MIPIRVYVKGFLSYRDEAELHFDGAPLWVLAGKNGSGKSAIFDAITFALYGLHRGGKSNYEELINKGSTELVVEFDFAIEGDLYRVKRTIARGKKSGFQAYHLNGATPRRPEIPGTEKKERFNKWVEETLGLDDKTFTASVLLRQGESEALLKADPKERHNMLAQIVNLSKYERLWDKANEKYKEHNANEKSLKSQLQDIEPVDEKEIERLKHLAALFQKEIEAARLKLEELSALKVHAKRWEKLEMERAELSKLLMEGKERLRAVEDEIEGKAATTEELLALLDQMIEQKRKELDALVELQTALPWLKQFDEARDEWLSAKGEAIIAAEEAATVSKRLSATIAEKEEAEQKAILAAEIAEQKRIELAKAMTLLEQAKDRFARLNEMDGSPTCSYCGQALSPEHLEEERARVTQEVEWSESNAKRCEAESREADEQRVIWARRFNELNREVQSLREQLIKANQRLENAIKNQERAESQAQKAINELPERFRKRIDCNGDIAACFASEFPTKGELSKFKEEVSNIPLYEQRLKKLRDLRPYIQKQQEREQRLAEVQKEITDIPEQARRPLKELEMEESETRERLRQAEKERNEAEKQVQELESRRRLRKELEEKRQKAAYMAQLYKQLAQLLGRENLQLHLLKQSEAVIVANANRVLDHISGGSLSLRLREEAEKSSNGRGSVKALDLVAYNRRAGGGSMPVAFLSGSQRFRVAISLALGIGQYAGRASRRIESVIIDEGFGSLDSEGQREMIDELNSLKNMLTRIILVSHQEAFADAFPNRYMFELTDGTSQVSLKDEV